MIIKRVYIIVVNYKLQELNTMPYKYMLPHFYTTILHWNDFHAISR